MNVLENENKNTVYDRRGRKLIRVYLDADNLEEELSRYQTTSGFPFNVLIERPMRWFLCSFLQGLATKLVNWIVAPVLEKIRKTHERIFRR